MNAPLDIFFLCRANIKISYLLHLPLSLQYNCDIIQDFSRENTEVLENKNWFQPIVAILAQKTAILVCVTVHSRHKRTESDKKTPFWKLLKKKPSLPDLICTVLRY